MASGLTWRELIDMTVLDFEMRRFSATAKHTMARRVLQFHVEEIKERVKDSGRSDLREPIPYLKKYVAQVVDELKDWPVYYDPWDCYVTMTRDRRTGEWQADVAGADEWTERFLESFGG